MLRIASMLLKVADPGRQVRVTGDASNIHNDLVLCQPASLAQEGDLASTMSANQAP